MEDYAMHLGKKESRSDCSKRDSIVFLKNLKCFQFPEVYYFGDFTNPLK